MRVLHVSDSYLPTIGGIELHLRDLVEHQRAAGHRPVVVTRPAAAATEPSRRDGTTVHRTSRVSSRWLAEQQCDVVHAHVSIVSPFALATACRAARLGLPTVVTVHSLWTPMGGLPALARDLWRVGDWPVTWSAVSHQAAEPIRRLLGKPVHVVPNAVDLSRWAPPQAHRRSDAGAPPDGALRVVSVMRLTAVKRAMPLVRVLGRVAQSAVITATIVGDGPQRSRVERYLRHHDLDGRVELTGTVGREQVLEQITRASVFVAPADRESFGIAALEARACGVPIVARARSGVAGFVEHDRTGLLAADDTEMIAQLIRLARDQELRERLAATSRSTPPDHGWSRALADNQALYVLARAAARQPRLRRSLDAGPVRAA